MLKCRPGLKIELLTIIINVLEVEIVQKKSSQINDNKKKFKKVLPNVLLSGALITPPKKFPNTKILTEKKIHLKFLNAKILI